MNKIFLYFFFFNFIILKISAQDSGFIKDNSFLIEEAFNQEKNVVQHINLFQFEDDFKSASCSFTQEWPLFSERNQLSYTIPYSLDQSNGFQISDLLLNYRYQLVSDEKIAFAPRLSFQIPTGKKNVNGSFIGFQVNLPVSIVLSDKFMLNLNLGTSKSWSNYRTENNSRLQSEVTTSGISFIYSVSSVFNLMFESVYSSYYLKDNAGEISHSDELILNPGFRYAMNFKSGLQIVPGASVAFNTTDKTQSYLFYLSFEHPF